MGKMARILSRIPLHAVIIFIALIWILPTLGVLVTSFRPAPDVAATGWWTSLRLPFEFTQYTLKNYKNVLTQGGISRSFFNSLLITIPATILPIVIAAFAAYAFAWMRFAGRRILFVILVALLIIPLQTTMIPILRAFNRLGLAGTFPGIWLAHTGYGLPLTIYLLFSFMGELPSELFDSAAIDGASTFQIFFRLVLPLSVSAIAAVTIFQFLWVWNDLLVALIYLGGTPDVAPVTVQVSSLVGSYGQNWEVLTAAVFVSMLLPLVIFFGLQRYFVKGLLAGSIKG